MLVFFAACGGSKEEERAVQLGTSGFSIILPEGYEYIKNDYDEEQVAYYYKDDESVDFDVYQWGNEGIYTLEEEAEYFAGEYGTTPTKVTINGIKGMKYISLEEYEGYEYTVLNYMFDDGENIVEVCFWTINTEEEIAFAEDIINSIAISE